MADNVKIKKKKKAKYRDYVSGEENSFIKAIKAVLFHRIYFMFIPHYHRKTKTVSMPIIAIFFIALIVVSIAFLSFSVLSRNAVVASRMARLEGSYEDQISQILELKNTVSLISSNDSYRDDLLKIFEYGKIRNTLKRDFNYSNSSIEDLEKVRLKSRELSISKQYIEELSKNIATKKKTMESIPTILPIESGRYSISSPYQDNKNDSKYVVFNVLAGTRVRAVASGEISDISYNSQNGFSVTIDHLLGISTTYVGLANLDVETGRKVIKGDTIGMTLKNKMSYQLKVASDYLDPLLFSTYSHVK